MADLSAYVSYTVTLDNSGDTPVVTIQDTSSFPGGTTVTSYAVIIIQPDGVAVTTNLFSGGSIVTKSIELRLANDGNLQNGTYVANATVVASDYDNTIKNYLFKLSYCKPKQNILPLIDVFTPNIKAIDNTNYKVVGMVFNSLTRAYSAIINSVGGTSETITATTQIIDLVYSGSYYDAQYIVGFTGTFQNTTLDGLIVKDAIKLSLANKTALIFDAFTPSTLSELLTGLDKLKKESYGSNWGRYLKAVSIYDQLVAQGQAGNTVGLQEYVIQLENMLAGYSLNRVHTNVAIPAYTWTTTSSTTTSIQLANGSTSWAVPSFMLIDTIYMVAPTGTTVTIGTTPGGTEISDAQTIDSGGFYTISVDRPYTIGNTIYFGGVLEDTQITIFKK